jgi:alanine-glyoxylate transaminase/serine-glyoxylate transaminase/serine-pyruvate transaminase
MPDRVLQAMHRAAPNIYAGALHELTASLWPDLKAVAGTTGHVALYIGNGHAGWEAANANMFSRGDRALVLATGRFGIGWSESARAMGIDVDLIDFGPNPLDLARVEAALRADTAHKIRAVLATQVDTASSVRSDVRALRALLDATGHPALLAIDCIASLGCDEYRMDDWGVDVTVAASQKGLMTPPGLAFIWFSPRAAEECRRSDLRTPYWNWMPRSQGPEYWQYFCGTAPTHHLYGLREALDMIAEETLPATWGRGNPAIALNVADPANRGRSVTSARLGAPHATRLREWTEREAGVTLGIGLGMSAPGDPGGDGFLRVAHMGHVNAHMTLGALAVMEAGMIALGIPHGEGALTAAARMVAQG